MLAGREASSNEEERAPFRAALGPTNGQEKIGEAEERGCTADGCCSDDIVWCVSES